MTQIELIDRLCAVNTMLTDIVREQAEIMAQHGIDELVDRRQRAEQENAVISATLRTNL
uniref:Uncharacterized protein n=1 Tax=Myoviridae sp. ctBvM24 TaxID=2825050 RepID=A0A8S5UD14_9CAUD|nr:MAG TPA: hypothetical protein [Myoviridae sp. ctBvM24]